MELFKHYYMTDCEYNLYEKGDASEFLQSFMELIHLGLMDKQNVGVDDGCLNE